MKLYQLEYFMAVCRRGSISQAADELLVSRPAVSRAVKDLEEEFGMSFLQRTTTGVALTEAGQLFFDKCASIEQMLAQLQAEMHALKTDALSESNRTLTVALSYTARCCMLPFLSDFGRTHPNVRLLLTDIDVSFDDKSKLTADYDVAISLCGDRQADGVAYITVRDTRLAFCCSKNHPLAGQASVSLRQIRDEPLVALSRLVGHSDNQVAALFQRYGFKPNIVYMTGQVSSLRQMIRENLCSSIKTPESMEGDSAIAAVPIEEAEPLHLRLLWDATLRHNSAFDAFISHVRTALREKGSI